MDEHTSRTLRNLLEQLGPEYGRRLQNTNMSTIDLVTGTNPTPASPTGNRKVTPKSTAPLVFHSPSSMPCVIMPGSITSSNSRLGVHGAGSSSNNRLGIPISSTTSGGRFGIPGSSAASNNHITMLQNTAQSSSGAVNLGTAQLSLLEHSNVLGVSAIQDNDRNLYICDNDADNQISDDFKSIYENSNQMSRQAFTMRRTRTNIPYSVKCQISKMAEESPRITQGEIAQIFGIDRTTVSKILKKRKMYIDPSSPHSPSKISRSGEHETSPYDLESTILNWYTGLQDKKASVTLAMVADAAKNLADVYGFPTSSIDTQWVSSFCRRHNIICSNDDFLQLEHTASKSSTQMSYKQGQFQPRNKTRTPERRLPPSAARGSASETPSAGQNLSQPKPTSQPIPNQTCNKIPRERSQFPTSGALGGLSDRESTGGTQDDQVSEKVVVKEEPEFQELGPEEALSRDLGTLEKFREQQKEIEEANKHKKALLAKTLSERQKKARMEAEKLTHIQKELMILDNLLSADVTVVRNRIEAASRDYMEATRRYDRAEREFIEAKLDLQKKSELKEQLTEHLYTIIHENEIRKAKKLSDLMTELDMETKGEQLCIGQLPPLSAFSSMGMPKIASPTSPKSPTSGNVPANKTDQKTASESPVSSSSISLTSTINNSDSTNADQTTAGTNLSNVVVDLTNENSTLPKESLCSPNTSSNDIPVISGKSESQGSNQNYAAENSDSVIGEEDLTINDNTEQPSHSSSADDSSSYNSALSSNIGGDNSSQSPKHLGVQDTEGTMPSSWTLDSVNIKEEPVT